MSWWQLITLTRLAAYERRHPARTRSSCPHDGERLRQGPDGGWYCPFDGYRRGAAAQPPGDNDDH